MIHALARMQNCRRAKVSQAAPATDQGQPQTEWQRHGQQTVARMTPGVGQTSSAWMRKMALSLWIILKDKQKYIPTLRLTTCTLAVLKHGTTASLNQVKSWACFLGWINLLLALTQKAVSLQLWAVMADRYRSCWSFCVEVAHWVFPEKWWWVYPGWQLICLLTVTATGWREIIGRAKVQKHKNS